jgi:hypothetical protein
MSIDPQEQTIHSAYFNRFDKELIDKFFNDEGKKAIDDYVKAQLETIINQARISELKRLHFPETGAYIEDIVKDRLAELKDKGVGDE